MKYSRPIWELMAECAQILPDRFRFGHVQRWFESYYPDINEHTLRVHLTGLTETPNNPNPYLAKKAPLFRRVSHGEYEVIGRRSGASESFDEPVDQAVPTGGRAAGTLMLVGHEHEQRDTPARARDLFVSETFTAARILAESNGAPWFILSSEHGLVRPETVLSPYERRLSAESSSFRRAWAHWVAAKLDSEIDGLEDVAVELRADSEIAVTLADVLESHGARLHSP